MARPRKYPVVLTDAQRKELLTLVSQGAAKAKVIRRAQTLLHSDGNGLSNQAIARLLHTTVKTITLTQQRFGEEGLGALVDHPRSGRPREVTKRDEALLTAIAASEPPPGRSRWTLRMIRDRFVVLDEERQAADGAPTEGEQVTPRSISHEKVRQVLKKMS